MAFIPFVALVRKDLQLFFSDRRAVMLPSPCPSPSDRSSDRFPEARAGIPNAPRVKIAIVDEDGSADFEKRRGRGAGRQQSRRTVMTAEEAKSAVREGQKSVAIVLPKEFGERAARSMFRSAGKPELDVFFDPSRSVEVGMVRGILTQHVMQAVSQAVFSGESGGRFVDEQLAELEQSGMPADQKQRLRVMLLAMQASAGAVPRREPPWSAARLRCRIRCARRR